MICVVVPGAFLEGWALVMVKVSGYSGLDCDCAHSEPESSKIVAIGFIWISLTLSSCKGRALLQFDSRLFNFDQTSCPAGSTILVCYPALLLKPKP